MTQTLLTPAQQSIAVAWGSVQNAVRDPALRSRPGGITQYVWEAYKQDYLRRGLTPPSVGLQAMNSMVQIAGRQARAEAKLARAIEDYRTLGRDVAITGEHLAADLDASPYGPGPLGPDIRIRYRVPVLAGGIPDERFGTWEPGRRLPASVGELLDVLQQIADGAAEDHGIDVAGDVTGISITTF